MRFLYNLLLLLDQLVNVLFRGDPSETVSMRCGRLIIERRINMALWFVSKMIDAFFKTYFKEENHCINAYLTKRLGDRDIIYPAIDPTKRTKNH